MLFEQQMVGAAKRVSSPPDALQFSEEHVVLQALEGKCWHPKDFLYSSVRHT